MSTEEAERLENFEKGNALIWKSCFSDRGWMLEDSERSI